MQQYPAHALTRTHFAASASPGNKKHSLSHWPRSVIGFFHSLPSLPLRSEGTRCPLWCCVCARASGLGRVGTCLCAQWILRTCKKEEDRNIACYRYGCLSETVPVHFYDYALKPDYARLQQPNETN